MGLTRTHQRQISLKHTRKHKTHAINQPFPAHESQPPRPLFSVSPISGGRKKAAPNTYKWILKINLKKKCSLACEIFFDLAVQVLGWWGYSHNPCHKGKSERIQTGPKRTTSSQYFASWKTDSAKEFTRSNSHQRQPVKYWFFIILPCSWNMEPSHRRVGLSLFPPKGAGGIPRVACLKKEMCCLEIIQVSRNTRLGSYSMWRPAKPAMPFKKSITSR